MARNKGILTAQVNRHRHRFVSPYLLRNRLGVYRVPHGMTVQQTRICCQDMEGIVKAPIYQGFYEKIRKRKARNDQAYI